MLTPLTKTIEQRKLPVLYLGIGSFEGVAHRRLDTLPRIDSQILKSAKLIIVRDPVCATILAPLAVHQLPCPALFSAPELTLRSSLKRIALSTQGIQGGQKIPEKVFHYTKELFEKIAQKYPCDLVCHYVYELASLKSFEKICPFVYSHDPRDYAEIYNAYDLTITTRVHGAGICASLGVPSLLINHSARSHTAEGFLSKMISPETHTVELAINDVDDMEANLVQLSKKLSEHKRNTFESYRKLLCPVLSDLGLSIEETLRADGL
jgi:hypothetical protein